MNTNEIADKKADTKLAYSSMTFTSREEYLSWRQAWKKDYQDVTLAIRIWKNGIEVAKAENNPYVQRYCLARLRDRANDLLNLLILAKAKASIQRKGQEATQDNIRKVADQIVQYYAEKQKRNAEAAAAKYAQMKLERAALVIKQRQAA